MKFLIIFLLLISIFLLTYLFLLKRELRSISSQLNRYNKLETAKKIDVRLLDKDIEKLAENINKHMNLSKELQLEQVKSKNELKNVIANISHDLRTPLTSILGYIQMIRSEKLSESKKLEYLDRIEERGRNLQELTSDFFMLSVTEAVDYEMKLDSVNLNEIICDVISAFYDEFVKSNMELDINILEENIMVLGEEQAIKRVLNNLMKNLIKHSFGKVKIILESKNENTILTIINNANGLSYKEVESIFDKFYIRDKARNSSEGNTGLGLAIVKNLMWKMEGNIEASLDGELLYIYCQWRNIKN